MKYTQITIKDIAKKIGVSPSTVSRALKDHPDISEKTRKEIQELAKELHYRPNSIALSLRQNKSNVIGVIVPQLVHHFFSQVISGIEDIVSKNKYNIIICQSNENYEREIQNIQTMITSHVAGILISRTKETCDDEHFKTVLDIGIPMVFFDRTYKELDTDKVIIDDIGAAYLATEHLIKAGCKRIVHFKGPDNLHISRKRLEGYRRALEVHNLKFDESLVILCDNLEDAMKTTQNLIDSNNLPDGIFAVNDNAAIGALKTLKRNNIAIPQQVAIVGFSNELISSITTPSLTTIEQNGYEIGKRAAELILKRINSKKEYPSQTIIVPTSLIKRESS